MPTKTSAQPATAPLKPGQRVRMNWEIAKSYACPGCGDPELCKSRQRQERDGTLPVFCAVISEFHGQVLWSCCMRKIDMDGYVIENEDGTVRFALPEWLEAF